MRAIRQSGSEGGGVQRLSLPYQNLVTAWRERRPPSQGGNGRIRFSGGARSDVDGIRPKRSQPALPHPAVRPVRRMD
jgi:hypothetical protein